MSTWDALRDSLLPEVKELLSEVWDRPGVQDFALRKTEQIAKETWLASSAGDQEERDVHRENLKDLRAHVKDEALIALKAAGEGFAARAGDFLRGVAGFLLGALEARLLGR